MGKNEKRFITFSPMFMLFLIFMVLRLTDVIDWSWWWVTAPLWGPFALGLGILVIFIPIWVMFMVIMEILDEVL